MKKVALLILLICYSIKAQVTVSIAVDPKMAIQGAYETSERGSLDLIVRIADRTNQIETGIQFEFFNALQPPYFSWGLFCNYVFPIGYDHEIYAGVEANQIIRKLERSSVGFLSIGSNAGYKYYIGNFGLGLEANYKTRPDFNGLWNSKKKGVASGYITFTYKFE